MSTHAARLRLPLRRAAVARPRPAYTRLAITGLLLIALAPAVMLGSGAVAGLDLSEAMFLVPILVVPLVTVGLVWRFGTWAKAVGILVGLAAALMMFWVAFGLAHPTSFGDFTPAVAFTLGFVATVGGGAAAIVASRRGRIAEGLEGNERRLTMVLVGLVALAAVSSLALNLMARDAVAAGVAEGATAATMRDFAFTPGTYTVAAGEEARILVHNSDPFMHDFTVPALGIETVTIVPGGEELITVAGAEPGTYTIYCTLHSDTDAPDGGEDGMVATLIVE